VPRPIRAITVDFWGTLVFEGPRADDRYRERRLADFEAILTRAGFRVSPRDLGRGYEQSGRELSWVWSENRDVPVVRHVASLLEGAESGLSARVTGATLDALVEAYAAPALLVPPRPDTGARAALEALAARGLRLAVVSNTMRTPGRTLRRILEAHGLLAPFDHLTFSDEVGVRKPAAEIFRLTLGALGVPADEAVHVGDDPRLDVEGARNAGLRVVQVLAAGREAGPPDPDLVIEGLGELPAAIETLERRA
jgi:putative hydrolase of the HAD superfamily